MSEFSAAPRATGTPPASAGAPAAQAAPTAQAPIATAHHLPAALLNAAAGSIVQGTVLGRDGHGHMLVKTPHGRLALNTALTLADGARVALQVRTAGAAMQIAILSVDGKPLAALARRPAGLPAGAGANLPIGPAAGLPANSARAPAAPATVPATPAAAGAPGPAAVGHGRVVAATFEPFPPPRGGTPTRGASTSASAGVPAEPPSQRLHHLYVRIDAGSGPAPGAVRSVPGVVVASGAAARDPGHPAGAIVVRTADGMFRFPPGGPGPAGPFAPGQTVRIDVFGPVLSGPLLDAAAEAGPAGRGFVMALTRDWPSYREAVAALLADPRSTATDRLPTSHPGPRLAADLVFLLAALRGGDVGAWLGRAGGEALTRAGRDDLARKLGDDFQALTRPALDPAGTDWRVALLPVHDGWALSFLRFMHRRRTGGQDADDGAADMDFVVDLTLSALGDVQIRGQIRERITTRTADGTDPAPARLDLVLATRTALPDWATDDLGRLARDAGAASGMEASLRFTVEKAFAEPLAGTDGGRAGAGPRPRPDTRPAPHVGLTV